MTYKLFPNADVSSLCPEEVAEINRYLFQDVPEDELLGLAAACAKPSFEADFQTFLSRRLSEAILMEEKNESESDVMNFLSEF